MVQVIDDLDDGIHAEVPPAVEGVPGQVRAAGGDRLADVAGWAEQHDQAVRVLGDQLTGDRGHIIGGGAGSSRRFRRFRRSRRSRRLRHRRGERG